MAVQAVPEHINFPNEEETVLSFWKEIKAFETSLQQSKNKPRYIFYDGPPFATGLPHYGHILAGTVKDVVTRWAHQSGFHVERRFGWDCHGLPVEYEIDKSFNIKGPEDVAKMGIDKYNAECRKIVSRYASEWEDIVTRLGRWIDFKNDYKTMYPWFMESIWWVFKQLYDKGLVYKGFKVMPFSTACSTPLSNFEAGQDYKEVQDPAVIISFPLLDDPGVSMIAWTTTPWTLPSNLTLCVHPDLVYVKVKDKTTSAVYIMMDARLAALFKTPEEYEVLDRFKGSTLEGKSYKPLFSYFEYMRERGAFKVCCDTYVTEAAGTGIVHQAPYFGEDDFRVNLKYGIVTKDMQPICPVDMSGRFDERVKDFEGQYVKDADKNIIKWLKHNGRLVHQGTTVHSYPFCWRSDTPLIYRAVPSWFVRVEQMQTQLLQSNATTHWVPDFVKEKRFGNWLKEARDWAISRNRYWGTPIPLWVSDDGQEVVCVGSVDELKELTGQQNITDLHRESIDQLTIPSRCGKGTLKRVKEVFDCWFESGSMPYAQKHYPFENRREFEDGFPGDFIAEGIDQTRGWFYTLQVLSTALFGKAPFKNLICHGLVLAADGQKMSKRKKNYPDPMDVVHKYGADAIRLYLINSPVVRADNLRFKEEGVRDVLKDVFLPWYNAYRFLIQNVLQYHKDNGEELKLNESELSVPSNFMDHWILSFTQSLIKFVIQEMAAYRLYTVVPRLVKFVDQLTNWYVRMNRRRLKGDSAQQDCKSALHTLIAVLFSMTKVMSPFIPFLTESMYRNLRHLVEQTNKKEDTASVHYLMLPQPREEFIDSKIEESVSMMQAVIELGRVVRDRRTMPMKYPLREVVVIHSDAAVLAEVSDMKAYIMEELNVKSVSTSMDKEKYGVRLKAEPDFRTLGARLGSGLKQVMSACKELTDTELAAYSEKGELMVSGHLLRGDDLKLSFDVSKSKGNASSQYEAHSDGQILVLLDMTPDQSMLDEGLAREVINRIQKARKKAKLVPTDDITIYYEASGELSRICRDMRDFMHDTVKQPMVTPVPAKLTNVLLTETAKVKTDSLMLCIVRRDTQQSSDSANDLQCDESPACPYLNVVLHEAGTQTARALVLLQNPCGQHTLSATQLTLQVQNLLKQQGRRLVLYKPNGVALWGGENLLDLSSSTLYAHVLGEKPGQVPQLGNPGCMFVNVHLSKNGQRATLLLENPRGDTLTSVDQLLKQADAVFGVKCTKLYLDGGKKQEVSTTCPLNQLHSKTIFAC